MIVISIVRLAVFFLFNKSEIDDFDEKCNMRRSQRSRHHCLFPETSATGYII